MAYGTNAPFGLRPISPLVGGAWTEKVTEYRIYASSDGATTYGHSIFEGDPVIWATSIGGTAANGIIDTIGVYNPNYADGTPTTFGGVGAAPTVGVFNSCEYFSTATSTNNLIKSEYWPANTRVMPGTVIKALVYDDPTTLYDVQVSTNIDAAANAFVGKPVFPNLNPGVGAPFILSGGFGRNFALMVGGGTNFSTVQINGKDNRYANNPAGGNTLTGQSGFYLCADTSTAAAYNDHDYDKTVATLPLRALYYSLDPRNVARTNPTDGVNPPVIGHTPFLNVTVRLNNHVNLQGSAATVYVA